MSESKPGTKRKLLWNRLKIRWKLFFIMLPSVIIPLMIMVIISSFNIYNHLATQGQKSYTTYLNQVALNVKFVYNQYAQTLSNMVRIPSVEAELNAPDYGSKYEEMLGEERLIGNDTTVGGLRNTVEERVEGDVFIVELDRKSYSTGEDYSVHKTSISSVLPVIEELTEDELFKRIKNDNSLRFIYGKPSPETFTDTVRSVMLFPYYRVPPQSETDSFEKFVIVHLQDTFITRFYNSITELEYGTLYILDINNNIISRNHPSDMDYYMYDEETKQYVLGEDDIDPGFGLTFHDYQMLNTNEEILQHDKVKNVIDKLNLDDIYDVYDEGIFEKKIFVEYSGITYLTVFAFDDASQTKYIYFHPVKHFQAPIYEIIYILLIFSLIIIFVVTFISMVLSKSFTKPINLLLDSTHEIAQGHYDNFLKTNSEDEIGQLTDNFNSMIKNIKSYQDQLLSAEREKSEIELASRIQTCLIPVIEEKEFYEIAATMLPAAMVGGDYYDVISEKDGRIWLGIGDVSGHGLMSGLIMMMAQTAFNAFLLNDAHISSDKLISNVNRVLFQNIKERLGEDHFMTLSFLLGDKDGNIKYAGCHEDILIYRKATKKVERVITNGIWLGLVPDIESGTKEQSIKLEKGDLIFLYTDGLIEAMDKNNNQYDVARLIAKLEELGELPVQEIEKKIKDDVFGFLHEQIDDITFIIVRKK